MKPVAVALLRAEHGESEARKIALTEQRRAGRARSKRRYAFWSDAAAQIKNENCNNSKNTRGPPARCEPVRRGGERLFRADLRA